ncbi:MAG: sialidase-1, partial [Pirellulaceae bacterium]
MRRMKIGLATLFWILACSVVVSAERPNALLIAVDDLRPELGCYGVGQVKTRNIDAFVQTALVANRAYCQLGAGEGRRTSTATGTSFEKLKAGALGKQSDQSGTWAAADGHGVVHVEHKRTGKQSLRLLGGEKRVVEWTPVPTKEKVEQLDFWFERWTKRAPFEFRVLVLNDGNWQPLHHDKGKAIVGSFKNKLTLPLNGLKPEKFRFESTTPVDSGVMIDDVNLTIAKPMRILGTVPIQTVSPVLIRNKVNPVLGIQIDTEGSQFPIELTTLNVRLNGTTNLDDIEYIEAYFAGASDLLPRDMDALAAKFSRFGKPRQPNGELVQFEGSLKLSPGANLFWISVKLKDS